MFLSLAFEIGKNESLLSNEDFEDEESDIRVDVEVEVSSSDDCESKFDLLLLVGERDSPKLSMTE